MLGFEITFWHWWLLAAALGVFELLAPSTLLIWPAMGAVVMGLITLIIPGIGIEWQILVFAIVSTIIAFAGVPYVKKCKLEGGPTGLNSRAAAYIGRNAKMEARTSDGRGYAWIDGTRWTVKTTNGSELGKDDYVTVIDAEGVTLTVKLDAD